MVGQVVATAVDTFGGLDVLVNNAGIMDQMSGAADVSDAEWERVIRVNLTAPFLLTRAVCSSPPTPPATSTASSFPSTTAGPRSEPGYFLSGGLGKTWPSWSERLRTGRRDVWKFPSYQHRLVAKVAMICPDIAVLLGG